MTKKQTLFLSFWLLVGLAGSPTAWAVDGVIEINQASAGPFPFDIDLPGSYRLTGDLDVPAGTTGININVAHVTLDLNGFSIASAGGPSLTDGISINAQGAEVRNGTIRGFPRHGIFAPAGPTPDAVAEGIRVIGVQSIGNAFTGIRLETDGSLVESCTVLENALGIDLRRGSLVVNSIARGNSSFGLNGDNTTAYRSNVFTENNGGGANPQVNAAIELGTNFCGLNTTCP